jgi:hypothetical protein
MKQLTLLAILVLVLSRSVVYSTVFPLKISSTHTYLTDARGEPFLIVGDTAWSLIAQLGHEDVVKYLDDRQMKGFNAIIVNLIEAKFATHAPKTKAGVAPFLTPGDFSSPNPAYFDWAHECLAAAQDRGIAVFLCPAYLGWGGGDEGFFKSITNQGPTALRAYGHFVAERFKDLSNIVWMPGGDYSMPDNERWTVHELTAGIRELDKVRLLTGHAGQKSPRTAFGNPRWLQVDNTYSYEAALWKPLLADVALRPRMPVFLSETTYEGEHKATPQQIRRQAWWAMLSGHCGQFFGNNPIWHFDGPGLFQVKTTWQEALDSPGSRDIARLGEFFRKLPWTELKPDTASQLVVNPGDGVERIMAASTPDGRLAVVYVPGSGGTSREITLRLDALRPATGLLRGTWFNPTDGTPRAAEGPPFRTPGDNGTGASDWVLKLEKL